MTFNEMELNALPTNQESYWGSWGNSEPPMVDDYTAYSAMMDGAYEDFGMGYGPMYDMMESASCSANAAPAAFTAGEANGTAPASMPNQVPHKCPPLLKGGDKDKSVKLYNHVAENYTPITDKYNRLYICRKNDPYHLAIPTFTSAYDELLNENCVSDLGRMLPSSTLTTVKDSLNPFLKSGAVPVHVGKRIVYFDRKLYYKFDNAYTLAVMEGNFYSGMADNVFFTDDGTFVKQVMPDFTSPATALPQLISSVFNINSEDLPRFMAHLCCFFLQGIELPLMVFLGTRGRGKSTATKNILSLVAPEITNVSAMPKNEKDLVALLTGKYIIGLDNVSKLTGDISDKLCVACTGGADSQRQLYTNHNVIDVPLNCYIIMNGISDFITRADLADRSNVFRLEKIKGGYKAADDMAKCFDMIKPKILGSIFNTICIGLPMVDTVLSDDIELPRMAEFVKYGAAFIQAMGLDPMGFVDDYKKSCGEYACECIEQDPFNALVKDFVRSKNNSFSEKASELLKQLSAYDEVVGRRVKRLKTMNSSSLSRALAQNADDLASMGVIVDIQTKPHKQITLTLNEIDD